MVSTYYCLLNLNTNQYLDDDLLLVKDYKKASVFDSKEGAVGFLILYESEMFTLGSDWTTREFFIIK